MSWPDAERPGEPTDPNRPWHWVAEAGGAEATPLPIGWTPHLRRWALWDATTIGPAEAAQRFRYLGPALTPEEASRALEAARQAAIPAEPQPPRGLAALAASALPEPPPAMVYRKDAIRNHILIFAGTLFGTLFLAEKFNLL
jgi:hypothetical protein